jgi:hypothetical protein
MEVDLNSAFAKWRKRHVLSARKDAQEYTRLIVVSDVYTGKNKVGCEWQDGTPTKLASTSSSTRATQSLQL